MWSIKKHTKNDYNAGLVLETGNYYIMYLKGSWGSRHCIYTGNSGYWSNVYGGKFGVNCLDTVLRLVPISASYSPSLHTDWQLPTLTLILTLTFEDISPEA